MPANDCVPFFASDYRGDAGVESLDFAGRGLWGEMYILMMTTRGIFQWAGTPIRENDLALIAKATRGELKDVRRIFPRVKASGVYSVREDGVIYSRKLVEYFEKKAKNSASGAKGGKATAEANAQARAKAKALADRLSETSSERSTVVAQSHTVPNQDLVVVATAPARTCEATGTELRAAARAFCSEALDAVIAAGFEGEAGDRKYWVDANEEAAQRLLREWGSEVSMRRWQQVLDDIKVGNLHRRDDISLRFLLRLMPKMDSHERRLADKSTPQKGAEITPETQSYLARLEAEERGAA